MTLPENLRAGTEVSILHTLDRNGHADNDFPGEFRVTLTVAAQARAGEEAPTITGAPAVSEAGADGAWAPGETAEVTLTFSEAVTADTTDGTPSVGLTLGGTESRSASYVRGSGTTALVFGYSLTDADGSHAALLVPLDSLALNGGAIRSQATGANAALGHLGAAKTGSPGTRGEGDPFTASFSGVPAGHDGETVFDIRFHLSAEPAGLSYRTVQDGLFEVTGGSIEKASRLVAGKSNGWSLRIIPSGLGDVTVQVKATSTCDTAPGVCTADGRKLAGGLQVVIGGPAVLSVADAEVQEGAGGSHVTVAGINLVGASGEELTLTDDDPFGLPEWANDAERAADAQELTADDLLLRSAFHLSSSGDGAEGQGPAFTAWGRVTTGGFEAEADGVTMDGDVTTGLVGFDAEWERALAGVMLSQSSGDGTYRQDTARGNQVGTVESSLTGVYPYASLDLNARVSAWALAGVGSGELTLRREGHRDMPTDISMRMGALGVKGRVLDGTGPSGVGLSVKSDAMWVATKSERTNEMVASEGDVTRLRLIVQGERVFEGGHGATFTPSAEVGLRHDGGDAGARTVRTGTRWQLGPDAVLGLEATRQTSDAGEVDHQLMLRAALRY